MLLLLLLLTCSFLQVPPPSPSGRCWATGCSLVCPRLPGCDAASANSKEPNDDVADICLFAYLSYTPCHVLCRLLDAAYSAIGLKAAAADSMQPSSAAAEAPLLLATRQRMKKLSKLVHPDKCSLEGTDQVPATAAIWLPLLPFGCHCCHLAATAVVWLPLPSLAATAVVWLPLPSFGCHSCHLAVDICSSCITQSQAC